MGGYTHMSVLDVEDSAEKFGFGETHETRFGHGDFEAEQTGFSLHRFKPGSGSRSATGTTRRRRSTSSSRAPAGSSSTTTSSSCRRARRSASRRASCASSRRATRARDPRLRPAARRGPRRGRPGLVELDHRQLGVDLYNDAWRLLEKERTPEEDDELLHQAHASTYHWLKAPECEPKNRARGEWICPGLRGARSGRACAPPRGALPGDRRGESGQHGRVRPPVRLRGPCPRVSGRRRRGRGRALRTARS